MKLYVTRDSKNMGELITLDLEDVIYIENYERTVLLHTTNGQFYSLMPSLSTYEHHIKQFDFKRLDRTNLVNLNKISHFDEERSLVFFKGVEEKDSKYGTVSRSMKNSLKKILDQHKP